MDYYQIPGTIRASFSFYNTKEEIDRMIEALHRAIQMLRKSYLEQIWTKKLQEIIDEFSLLKTGCNAMNILIKLGTHLYLSANR